MVDASGTFNPLVRDAALTRATQAGAVLINWFAVACELQKDWRLPPNAGQVRSAESVVQQLAVRFVAPTSTVSFILPCSC